MHVAVTRSDRVNAAREYEFWTRSITHRPTTISPSCSPGKKKPDRYETDPALVRLGATSSCPVGADQFIESWVLSVSSSTSWLLSMTGSSGLPIVMIGPNTGRPSPMTSAVSAELSVGDS